MCKINISEEKLQKIKGEYVEARCSSVIYHDLNTQKSNEIQSICKEGLSIRIVDNGRLKVAYADKGDTLNKVIQSAEWKPISGYTPVDPVRYHEKPSEHIELPVEAVYTILETLNNAESVEARLESLTSYEHICTSSGTDVWYGNSKLFVRIFLTPIKGFTIVYSFGYPGENVTKALERLEEIDMHQFSNSRLITPERYDVVLSPHATGMIFHEIVHLFEGSVPGVPGFPAYVTISDDPTGKKLGSYKFDSEGCKTAHHTLVKDGVIQGCLASIFEPGTRSPTGNARASSFDVQPIPRQSNIEVKIQSEQYTKDELLEIVKNGVYIDQIGQASIFPGNIVYFANTISYHIEKGEIQEPLLNINFGGNLMDIITSIQCAAPTHRVIPSVCWKKYQRLFTTTKAPFSLIEGMPLHAIFPQKA